MGLTISKRPEASFNSSKKAPSIAGIDIRNEYSPAFSLSIPERRAADIVIPDLEIPGRTPNP